MTSLTFTVTNTTTFTASHARHMVAKVATDLKRIQRFYGDPDDMWIARYEAELIALLRAGYLGTVTYGYRRNGRWIEPTLKYTARDIEGMAADDDDPGRIQPGANTDGAVFCSYLTYSALWSTLSATQREAFQQSLPFRRSDAPEPAVDGYLTTDRIYSAGGRALDRALVRSYK